jgi:DNA-directed RNA polymerase specialized sigma24 family protein
MLDPLLAAFVEARDEADAQDALAALLEQHARPLARAVAARKLVGFGRSASGRPDDVDDVVGEVMLVMVDRLGELRRSPGQAAIESLADYTAGVTHNVLAHLFRQRHPERARLKNRLRYLLAHRDRIAIWETGDQAACGLAAARSGPVSADAMAALRQLDEDAVSASTIRGAADSPEALGRLVEEVLHRVERPVDFDAFVGAIARLCRVDEPRLVADPDLLASRTPEGEVAIDRRRALEAAWAEITELPERQRAALLLSLREARGGSLLWMLPLTGVASVRDIAMALGFPDADLADVWPRLPLDDAAIAQRLACTRQQVINLRMAARKRLANRHAARVSSPAAARGGRANLAAVSSSLEGDA